MSTADEILRLLGLLRDLQGPLPVDQLEHSLQAATRAERAGGDDDWVVAALCHDIGKSIPFADHALIAAQVLRPFVRENVSAAIALHTRVMAADPTAVDDPSYALSFAFVTKIDRPSFDPAYNSESLAHFDGRLRTVFGRKPLSYAVFAAST